VLDLGKGDLLDPDAGAYSNSPASSHLRPPTEKTALLNEIPRLIYFVANRMSILRLTSCHGLKLRHCGTLCRLHCMSSFTMGITISKSPS
jgi:hypothetical protein